MAKVIIRLNKIDLLNDGAELLDKEDVYLFKFSLLHPRFSVNSVVAPWVIKYGKKPNTIIKSYLKGLIFKEVVEGPFQLKVELAALDQASDFAKYLTGVLKVGAGVSLGVLTSGISSPIITAMRDQAGKNILDYLFNDEAITYDLGSGTIDLDSENLVTGALKPIDLIVEKVSKKPVLIKPTGRRTGRRIKHEIVIDKGANGTVSFDIEVK